MPLFTVTYVMGSPATSLPPGNNTMTGLPGTDFFPTVRIKVLCCMMIDSRCHVVQETMSSSKFFVGRFLHSFFTSSYIFLFRVRIVTLSEPVLVIPRFLVMHNLVGNASVKIRKPMILLDSQSIPFLPVRRLALAILSPDADLCYLCRAEPILQR